LLIENGSSCGTRRRFAAAITGTFDHGPKRRWSRYDKRPAAAIQSELQSNAPRERSGTHQTNKSGVHAGLVVPSLLAPAARAGPGIEGHALRVRFLTYRSLGSSEFSTDVAGGCARACHRFQLANVSARPPPPLCSFLGHWNLRSEL